GATSAMAEHCARAWLLAGASDVVLLARNQEKLDRLSADLRVRAPDADISGEVVDFQDAAKITRTVAAIGASGAIDIALIAHGSLPDQDACQDDLDACNEALAVNGLSPVLFAEAFAQQMTAASKGTICIIGSVAGDRGRKTNYVYGAAKGLVTRYAEGMQHRLADSAVNVVLIKPGPTDTPMTAHLKSGGAKMAPVEDVAADIVKAVEKASPVVYTPFKWRIIMLIIQNMPRFIFNKLNI
ncbi:MAG: SDR family NAD(P)-dependent oxidoreductase, partial [Pseudomonadota bacterium]